MNQPLLDYLRSELAGGRQLGVFSCEDPRNTRFHQDLLALSPHIHLKTSIGAQVELASIELGTLYKNIDSWVVVGHTDGLQLCGAIHMIMQGADRATRYLRQRLEAMQATLSFESTLEGNIRAWIRHQRRLLEAHIEHLQQTVPEIADKKIPVRAGIIRYVGELYISELLD